MRIFWNNVTRVPILHSLLLYSLCPCGEGGIRTPGTLLGVRQFSKLLLSATQAPLLLLKTERKSKKVFHAGAKMPEMINSNHLYYQGATDSTINTRKGMF